MSSPTNSTDKEFHPFRKIAKVSFIKGCLTILLGLILLFLIKSDLQQEHFFQASLKIGVGAGFLAIGIRALWRGYKNEYHFSLKDVFDPSRDIKINYLLGQRTSDRQELARHYINMFRGRNASLSQVEKGQVKDWQFIFYKLASRKGVSDIFEYIPYPITRFISNQSKPVSLIGFFLLVLALFGFIGYLEIIPVNMIWVNLFILVGLLTLWHPAKIDSVINRHSAHNTRNRIFFFILFYLITLFLYQPYADTINLGLFIAILALAAIIVYTALLAFRLIEETFGNRKQIDVAVSNLDLKTHRVATQPNNILQQFDNIISRKTGWYFKNHSEQKGGALAGDQIRKGDFSFEYVYESNPEIVATSYTGPIEKKLGTVYFLGTLFIGIGLLTFFAGILTFPVLEGDLGNGNAMQSLAAYSPKILLSLFLILFGTAVYFFGSRLIYEIYLFFNTEIFFRSDLILFKAYGNYDEYEHINGGIKRKDTFTDFTPDIEVARVTSSIFVHPYMKGSDINRCPRFVTGVTQNDQLLEDITSEFRQNLKPYLMSLEQWKFTSGQLESGTDQPEG